MTTCRRYSIDEYVRKLCAAVESYDYPRVTYDFEDCREIRHSTMSEVEEAIRAQLLSQDLTEVKDGLSNVLYWGMYRMGIQDNRVRDFRDNVTDHQLHRFKDIVRNLLGPGLSAIRGRVNNKEDNMPQFTKMSFVSKIRMFLDPEYPVLDKKLAEAFSQSACFPPLQDLKFRKKADFGDRCETSIRITKDNEGVYEEWARWCRCIANLVNSYPASPCKDLRAVDVERAIFQLSQSDKQTDIQKAWRLLKGPKPDVC